MSATIGDTGAYITTPGQDTVIGAYILLTDISPHMSTPTRRMATIHLMDTIHTGITRISVGLGSSTGGGTRGEGFEARMKLLGVGASELDASAPELRRSFSHANSSDLEYHKSEIVLLLGLSRPVFDSPQYPAFDAGGG